MSIIIAIGVIIFLIVVNGRVNRLEAEVRKLSAGAVVAHASSPSPQVMPQMINAQNVALSDEAVASSFNKQQSFEPQGDGPFVKWVKEDWLLKLGAFIVLLGLGWFVSYAFAQNWIGPMGRVTLGMLLGVAILGFGWYRMHTYERQGSVFLGLGAMTVLVAAFSSAYVYTLIPDRAALLIMFITSAFMALASVQFNVHSLAVVGIVIASIAPSTLLIHHSASTIELFAYLFVVVLGTVWIVALTGWRNLTGVALLMFFLYSLPHLEGITSDSSSLLVFAYAFALLFFVTNTIGILKIKASDIQSDTVVAAANGLLLLAWIDAAASPEWKSLVMVGWMVVFTITAFVVYSATKRKEPFFVYAGVGIAMLAAATAIEFEGAVLTIAYTIEGAMVPLVVYFIIHNTHIAKNLTYLLLAPVLLSFGSIMANWSHTIPFDHFFVLLILSGTLLFMGVFFWSLPREEGESSPHQPLFVGGSVYAYILLWLSLHATFADKDNATMVCLVIYTIIGLIAYAYGRLNENKGVHYYGGVLLAFTIGHLLLIDVWNMALSGRIVTFLLVGALLMGTAFMSKKKKSIVTQS